MMIRMGMGLMLAALLAGAARAQIVDQLSPAARTAMADWGNCLGRYVQSKTASTERAEDITSAALKLCEPQERVTFDLFGKDFGADGREAVIRYRSTYSAQAARMITEARAGGKFSDPLVAWGNCVGEHTQKAILASQDDPATVADNALRACQQFEDTARKANATGDPKEDEKSIALGRKALRDQSMEFVRTARSRQ